MLVEDSLTGQAERRVGDEESRVAEKSGSRGGGAVYLRETWRRESRWTP